MGVVEARGGFEHTNLIQNPKLELVKKKWAMVLELFGKLGCCYMGIGRLGQQV